MNVKRAVCACAQASERVSRSRRIALEMAGDLDEEGEARLANADTAAPPSQPGRYFDRTAEGVPAD